MDPTWWILDTILVDCLQIFDLLLVDALLICDGLLGCLVARLLGCLNAWVARGRLPKALRYKYNTNKIWILI